MEKLKLNGVIIEDNPDPRDYDIAQFVPGKHEIEDKEFMLKMPKLQVIICQGNIGACVGHAFAIAKSILEYNQTNKWIDFDPFVIYGTRFDEDNYTGIGMIPRQGAKALHKEGAFLRRDFGIEQEMPMIQDTVEEWKRNNPGKVAEAKGQVITGYSYVYNINQAKKALKNGMPICASWKLYESFYETARDGMVKVPNIKTESYEGSHMMCIVGWTSDNRWIVVNSWGTASGFHGMYFIPFNYAFSSGIAVSDKITPSTYKAKEIKFSVNGVSTEYIVDGIKKQFDVLPYIKNNRTYVPVRFITESLGASVEWDQETKTVTIRSEEAIITMQIGNRRARVNGKIQMLETLPEIVNNRTMLPIKNICDALNCSTSWDQETKTVTINAL